MRLNRHDEAMQNRFWEVFVNGKRVENWQDTNEESGIVIAVADGEDPEQLRMSGYTDPDTGVRTITLHGAVTAKPLVNTPPPTANTTNGYGGEYDTMDGMCCFNEELWQTICIEKPDPENGSIPLAHGDMITLSVDKEYVTTATCRVIEGTHCLVFYPPLARELGERLLKSIGLVRIELIDEFRKIFETAEKRRSAVIVS